MALPTPSPTLYISNLETKTKKPELRQQLYSLFTPYGQVIDIVAKKHDGGRGQAFVVFSEQAAATAAMRGLTGERFYDRDLRISYAKKPSNAYIARTNPEASREAAAIAAAKTVLSRAQGEYEQLEREREADEAGAGAGGGVKRAGEEAEGPAGKRVKREGEDEDEEEMEIEMDEEDEEEEEDAAPKAPTGVTLICTNLPPECNEQIMSALFSQFTGFSRAAPLPTTYSPPSSHPTPNPNARAFRIVFDSPEHAEAALQPNQGFLMQPGWAMGVSVQ
ncbi:hypothetical protein EHS25_009491 [Saitozyma podzolica]|uniref:RRM domain-containing protein n=1 Tax=Saitozyma podzolica TaxID=1890683 RepID=A0A427YJC2_9TREE|nr:hypothetical protein EHS25_009491 [Saitozyma podzolica]